MIDISDFQMDMLKEVGNVGTGNAATVLSQMINKKIEINIPETRFITFDRLSQSLGNIEKKYLGSFLANQGEVKGQNILAFSETSAKKVLDMMMGQPAGTTTEIDEMGVSAINELANIVVGAYLSALANMTELAILPSLPKSSYDYFMSFIETSLAPLAQNTDVILYVKTEIKIEGEMMDGVYIIFFDEDSLSKIIEKLESKFGL